MTLREAQYGLIPYLATGKVLPEDTVEAMDEADAILWGATGGPETREVPPAARKAGSLLSLRRKYDLYANLRPIVASAALANSAPLKAEVLKGVDFVIIRELTSGIYFGEPRGIESLPDGQRRGFNTEQYTTNQIRRVACAAFELARTQRTRFAQSTRQTCWKPACVARGGHRASQGRVLRRRTHPSLCRQRRHADRPGTAAIRRHGHWKYLRRHSLQLCGDGVGLAGHAAIGVARTRRSLRAAEALRAGSRQRPRYRRQRRRESARIHSKRRDDAAYDAEPARGCGPTGKSGVVSAGQAPGPRTSPKREPRNCQRSKWATPY